MSIGDFLEVPTSPPPATLSAAAEACARPGAAAATPVATLSRFGELMGSLQAVFVFFSAGEEDERWSPLERDPASCHAHGAPLHGEASGSLLFHTVLRAPLRAGARACCSHAFDVFLAYLACDRRASPWAACRCCAA